MSTFRPISGRAVAAALLLASLASEALATPDFAPIAPTAAAASAAGAVDRFLVDKGVLVAAPAAAKAHAPAFVEQVRHQASDMVITALNFLGVPYRRGGNNADDGFDCSGFTRQVFETSLGLVLPRRADQQAKASNLVAVKRDELQPGDLVFFNTLKRTFSHVGIYIGEGRFIHAPKPGAEVRVESMNFAYWAKRFTGARRVEAAGEQPATAASLLNAGALVSGVAPR